ncbi:MAG: DedA family protein [Pyrinomonadaceae bacterium]
MEQIEGIIREYGIYAVFALCTVEGDITLLISGAMAHSNSFGERSFFQVFIAGVSGGLIGDSFGFFVGRIFRETVKNFRFYKMAQPRIERLVEKFGGASVIISKYIYGIRVGMVVFNGMGKMSYWRFLMLDFISCSIWVTLLAGAGYFFSGAISGIIGDFQQIGITLFFILAVGVIGFYLIERFWLSKKVEQADPKTIHKIEKKIHVIEEAAQEKLHDIGERLHLTNAPNREEEKITPPPAVPKTVSDRKKKTAVK